MRPRLLLSVALLATVVSLGVSYGVHAYRSAQAPALRDPLAALDLTGDQQRELREVFRGFHPRLVAMQGRVDGKRAELAAALEACLAEISRLEAERDREVVKDLLLLRPHLSHEQQSVLFRYIELRHPSGERTR
jgi:uncharacterized membrane protein